MGCHKLRKDVGCRKKSLGNPNCASAISARLRNLGMRTTLSSECQALQGVRDKYPDLFGEHAVTMAKFTEQADLHGVAKFVTEVCANAGPM